MAMHQVHGGKRNPFRKAATPSSGTCKGMQGWFVCGVHKYINTYTTVSTATWADARRAQSRESRRKRENQIKY